MNGRDIERTRSALCFIDASDRDTWVKMGMAVKSELGDAGFDVWNEWSQRAESFDPKGARATWKSIRANGGVTAGTLFHEAKARGWCNSGAHPKPTPEEIATRRRDAAERTAKAEAERTRKHVKAAKKSATLWRIATPVTANNPYLARKGVAPVDTLREIDAGAAARNLGYAPKSSAAPRDLGFVPKSAAPLEGRLLVVPVKVGDALATLELIDGAGRKHAIAGGAKARGYWAAQPLPDGDGDGLTLMIGEGAATVLSAREATGHPVVAALSSGNLRAVAKIMRERYPAATIVILADLMKTTGEPDQHAIEAARSVDARVAIPAFGVDRPEALKDFNDMAQHCGPEAVRLAVANARAPGRAEPQPREENAPAAAVARVGADEEIAQTQSPLSLLISAHDIVSTARAPEYLIHGLIEHNTLAAMVAPWGAGKSLITLDMAIRIVLGLPVHGRKVQTGPVIIVAGEGHGGIARRLAAWQAHHGEQIPADRLYYTRRAVPIRDAAAVGDLYAEVSTIADRSGAPPVLIVLDTLSRNFGPGDENSNADMASFIDAVDIHLRLPFGAAVLVLHHPGHMDKTRGRGASALPGAVDVEYMLETDAAGVIRMTAPNKRPRDFRAADALHWRIVSVPLLLDDQHVDAVTVDEASTDDYVAPPKTEGLGQRQTAMRQILTTELQQRRTNLTSGGYDPDQARIRTAEWRQLGITAGAIGDHRNDFYKVRDSLVERGVIRVDGAFVELVSPQ